MLLKNDFIIHEDKKLFRIRALQNFSGVKKGDTGGYVESENNLSQFNDCWVCGDAYCDKVKGVIDESMLLQGS